MNEYYIKNLNTTKAFTEMSKENIIEVDSSYVSIKISPTKYKHFKVDEEVKTYIMQLENAINNEEVKNILKELYPRLNQNEDE